MHITDTSLQTYVSTGTYYTIRASSIIIQRFFNGSTIPFNAVRGLQKGIYNFCFFRKALHSSFGQALGVVSSFRTLQKKSVIIYRP